jgi:hypothetical protein
MSAEGILPWGQADQNGRVFAHEVIENLQKYLALTFRATYLRFYGYAFIWPKNGLGYILNDFFFKLIWSQCLGVKFCPLVDFLKSGLRLFFPPA